MSKESKPMVVHLLSSTSKVPCSRAGAVQTVAINLAKGLTKNYNSTIIAPLYGDQEPYEKIDGVNYVRVRKSFPLFYRIWMKLIMYPEYYAYVLTITYILNQLDPKVVIVHNKPAYIKLLKKKLNSNIKLVLYEHSHNLRDMLSKREARKVLGRVDAVVELSNFSKNRDIVEKFSDYSNKAYVIHNAVDTNQFTLTFNNQLRGHLRKENGLENKQVILFTGAIRKRKGIHLLVEAFEQLITSNPNVFLLVVGGSKQNKLPKDKFGKAIIKKLQRYPDNSKYIGFIPHKEVSKYYLMSDVYCCPVTWDEPFGLGFLEAMASGLPVVASNKGGITEIVEDQVTGYLIDDPENNVADIAGKLDFLLTNDDVRGNMGRAGRQRVEEHFTWKKVNLEIERLF